MFTGLHLNTLSSAVGHRWLTRLVLKPHWRRRPKLRTENLLRSASNTRRGGKGGKIFLNGVLKFRIGVSRRG